MKQFKRRIAPENIIRKDFSVLRSTDTLCTNNDIQDLIFVQSIEGRSHNGAGAFNKRNYVNTSIDDIVRALNRDPEKTKAMRQGLIDDIVAFVESTINDEKRDKLVNAQGEPFLGYEPFRDRKVNARDILRGLYLGGLRDNAEVRKETEKRYQINIGCGECYAVNTRVMTEMNLDGELLAHDSYEEQLDEFVKAGLIVTPDNPAPEGDEIRHYYIRHHIGPGQSDDAAIVMAGILYNIDVALGVFLSDAIDTLEKYAPEYKDQDQDIAYYIGRAFEDLQITIEDAYELSFLCAIPIAEEDWVADSSLRYLLSWDDKAQMSTIESHLKFIEGKSVPMIPVSYKRIANTRFYKYVKRRLLNVRRLDALAMPDLDVRELNLPIKDFAKENYITVDEKTELSTVIRRIKEEKPEVVILTDSHGRIRSTVSVTDLIRLTS